MTGTMTLKDSLIQYCDIQEEIKDIKNKIDRIERQLEVMQRKGYEVADSVTGGAGGTQHFKIIGYPYPEYTKKRTLLMVRQQQLCEHEERLLEQTNIVEKFINEIEQSNIRRMITYRFFDNLTWNQIAIKMNGNNTEDSCRKAVERFLEKI